MIVRPLNLPSALLSLLEHRIVLLQVLHRRFLVPRAGPADISRLVLGKAPFLSLPSLRFRASYLLHKRPQYNVSMLQQKLHVLVRPLMAAILVRRLPILPRRVVVEVEIVLTSATGGARSYRILGGFSRDAS